MNTFPWISAVLMALLVSLPLAAQPKNVPSKPVESKAAEMAEDVEILRLLLNKSFGLPRKVQGSSSTTIDPLGSSLLRGDPNVLQGDTPGTAVRLLGHGTLSGPSQTTAETFDGVHLKGHGIAFTIRLSMLTVTNLAPHEKVAGLAVTCQNCHPIDAVAKFHLGLTANAAKEPTDWEKARNELRSASAPKGDGNASKSNVADICVPGSLTESIVKLLAANGRNLRHLPGDESVTVVVTYDGVSVASHDFRSTTLADPTLWNPQSGGEEPYTKFGLTPEESKQIVLGDLHMKQSKYAEAAKAFEVALARFASNQKLVAPPKNFKPADLEVAIKDLQASVTAAYRSLAQAYIGVGNLDAAKRALELAQKMEIKLEGGDRKLKGTPVPAKIILSVKKSHLDAAEKLAPAEFRKGVTVETVGLTAIRK